MGILTLNAWETLGFCAFQVWLISPAVWLTTEMRAS